MEASTGPLLATLGVAAVGGFAIFLSMADPGEIDDYEGTGRRGRRGKMLAQLANSIGPVWVPIIVTIILAGCLAYWFMKLRNRPQRHVIEF
ncbi:MAG: hypothetical protein AAF958_07585 [Planctomycetota bacterium]